MLLENPRLQQHLKQDRERRGWESLELLEDSPLVSTATYPFPHGSRRRQIEEHGSLGARLSPRRGGIPGFVAERSRKIVAKSRFGRPLGVLEGKFEIFRKTPAQRELREREEGGERRSSNRRTEGGEDYLYTGTGRAKRRWFFPLKNEQRRGHSAAGAGYRHVVDCGWVGGMGLVGE